MLLSRYFFATYRKDPAPAESTSHSLMLRSGMIKQLGAGIYTWLPLGLRVLHKMARIIREEMENAGALEISMPALQPAELWEESERWQDYGPELMRLHDRHKRSFCLGPTHEEVVTDLVRNTVHSYKQLPINLYQIQTKFRDEIRPRFGVMRAREFMMKDAYSFHQNQQSLQETYQVMRSAYERIFSRAGLTFSIVAADSGNIGGSVSHEFHVLADYGEDAIAVSKDGSYAANVELAEAITNDSTPAATQEMRKAKTGDKTSIDEVSKLLNISPKQAVKTLVVNGSDTPAVALLVRGDHQLNAVKAARIPAVASPLQLTPDKTLRELGLIRGNIGPIGLKIPIIADRAVAVLADFCCGASVSDYHYTGVNWGRDCALPEVADLRCVVSGDPSPDGKSVLEVRRGIEVGHIFQLGQKYSKIMNLSLQGETGKQEQLWMGCYGIGLGRVVAAAIEQNHDKRGMIFSPALTPFQLAIVPVDMQQSEPVRRCAQQLYQQFTEAGVEVLMDDREQRLGVKLNDMELFGIPHRLVVSKRGLANGQVEYKRRDSEELTDIAVTDAPAVLIKQCTQRDVTP